MERPGEKLRQARERLQLTYRDVAEASQLIAARRGSEEFAVALSRLADIENKGTVPTIYRLYTLSAIYRLDWKEVLRWYGVPLDCLTSDAFHIPLPETHAVQFWNEPPAEIPDGLDRDIDIEKTTFIGLLGRRWGKMPLLFFNGPEHRQLQYGLVGMSDWFMYPVVQPGSLVLIDQTRRKIVAEGWTGENDRPIYFVEHRDGYHVAWCANVAGRLLLQPHPSSSQTPILFDFSDVDICGQVVGIAMLLESKKRRLARSVPAPAPLPNP